MERPSSRVPGPSLALPVQLCSCAPAAVSRFKDPCWPEMCVLHSLVHKPFPPPILQVAAPALPCTAQEEEEEEDQWEDVSEGEEEGGVGAAEGSGSQGSLVEEQEQEQPPPSTASQGKGSPQLSLAMPVPLEETPSTERKPLTPFSPAEGYHPVSDWGEEMELSSPSADAAKSPLAAHRQGPLAIAGKGEGRGKAW